MRMSRDGASMQTNHSGGLRGGVTHRCCSTTGASDVTRKTVGLKIVIKGMKVEDRNGTINIKTAHTRANWLTRPPGRGHDACCVGYGFGRDNNMTIHTRHTSRHVH